MEQSRKRPDFADGGMLTAEVFAASQDYLVAAQRMRNSSLRTAGVVDGLTITVRSDRASVDVSPGLALDRRGRAIVLAKICTIDLADVFFPSIYVTVRYASEHAEWRAYMGGSGYTRLVDEARFDTIPTLPCGPDQVVLARLAFSPDRNLAEPDLAVRQYCSLQVGGMLFPRPGLSLDRCPALEIDAQRSLAARSDSTDFFGSLQVEGRVRVDGARPPGSAHALVANPPQTTLEIFTPPPQKGAGTISRAGDMVFGDDAVDLAKLAPGDYIVIVTGEAAVPFAQLAPGDYVDPKTIQSWSRLRVTQATGRNAVAVKDVSAMDPGASASPVSNFNKLPYAVAFGAVLQISTGDRKPAIVVSTSGNVGIGTQPRTVALAIGEGDLRLDAGQSISFSASGSLYSGDPSHRLEFCDASSSLEVHEAGDLAFVPYDAPSDAAPLMILTKSSRVGIGFADPPQRLTVNGAIRAWGLIFPDDTIQTSGVVPIPIGTVLDWFHPPNSPLNASEGFQICDGSAITDPDSPLLGMKTPDLRGIFVRGTIDKTKIGTTGGAPQHQHDVPLTTHTHTIDHAHQVQGTTLGVSDGGMHGAGTEIIGSQVDADHTHAIPTTSNSGDSSPNVSGAASLATPQQTTEDAALPCYMDLLKIMRIK